MFGKGAAPTSGTRRQELGPAAEAFVPLGDLVRGGGTKRNMDVRKFSQRAAAWWLIYILPASGKNLERRS